MNESIVEKVSAQELLTICGSQERTNSNQEFYITRAGGYPFLLSKEESLSVSCNNAVFIVMKDSDFTEGRGKMFPLKAFGLLVDAVSYIMSNVGIYGSKQVQKLNCGLRFDGSVYAYNSFNGYEIKVMTIE